MRKWIPFVLVATAVTLSVAFWSKLPEAVPSHWNWRGEIDSSAPRAVAVSVLPILMVILIGLFHALPRLDPMRRNYQKFWAEYEFIIIAITAFCLAIHVALLTNALGYHVSVIRFSLIAVGLLFAGIGNIMPRIGRNHIAGFRTGATLSSDAVWTRTHRVGGAIMMAAGFLIALGAFVPEPWGLPLLFVLVLAMTAVTTVYSRRFAREAAANPTGTGKII